jgi:hypothetical protein
MNVQTSLSQHYEDPQEVSIVVQQRLCNTLIFIRIENLPTNAFHLNNNLIGLHFMACIFLFLSPRSISIFEKI